MLFSYDTVSRVYVDSFGEEGMQLPLTAMQMRRRMLLKINHFVHNEPPPPLITVRLLNYGFTPPIFSKGVIVVSEMSPILHDIIGFFCAHAQLLGAHNYTLIEQFSNLSLPTFNN